MIRATRILEFDAGHRLLNHESKCAHLHGHRYKAEVYCAADDLDSVGRVVDFGVIKSLVGGWLDEHWDHATIVNSADISLVKFLQEQQMRHYILTSEPSAENMARHLVRKANELLFGPTGVTVSKVVLWETPNCFAEARADD